MFRRLGFSSLKEVVFGGAAAIRGTCEAGKRLSAGQGRGGAHAKARKWHEVIAVPSQDCPQITQIDADFIEPSQVKPLRTPIAKTRKDIAIESGRGGNRRFSDRVARLSRPEDV